jgi:hypothetical protein
VNEFEKKQIMDFKKEEYLQRVLESYRMAHIQTLVNKHKKKRDEIKEALEGKYSGRMYSPINSGSFGKHTAINTKFDLDIVVPFKRSSFDTIENMFEDVHEFLSEKYQEYGKAEVSKQKVSIGVSFSSDEDGDEINIDVVPGRELNNDTYIENKDLNIYFNEAKWGFSKGSYTKTNIQAQIDYIKARENERRVIRLLKIWKNTNTEKNYKSFLLELLTIKAFDKVDISGNLWEKLKGVLEYIKESVIKEDFTLKDPGNSNNDVIKTLETWERSNLSNKINNIVARIEDNFENIKTYFPINENFDNKEASDNSYGIKGTTLSPSIPANNQRFG